MVALASLSSSVYAGDVEKDFWYALDLLRSPKDHVEFTLVRDFVRDALLEVCSQVKLDTEKSVLKQAAVQHLYGRLSGTLKLSANESLVPKVLTPDCKVINWEKKASAWLVSGIPGVCIPADQAKIECREHSVTPHINNMWCACLQCSCATTSPAPMLTS